MNFKQFFNLLRQQRLFSGIYVLCTALGTALTLTLFLVLYIMVGPIYPEQERSRMAVVNSVGYEREGGGYNSNRASAALADSLRKMPEVEWLTAIRLTWGNSSVKDAKGERVECVWQPVDESYWHVFNFRFIQGRPFTREECEAESPVCVISESLARRLFGRTDARELFVRRNDDVQVRVVGIVEDASLAAPLSYAQMWTPSEKDNNMRPDMIYMGNCTLVMLLREGKTLEQLQARVARFEEKVNQELAAGESRMTLHLYGQPYTSWQSRFQSAHSDDWKPFLRKVLGLLLAFLLIPAMNMSSMVASRVSARTSEMGIRRAYGAGRATLLWQVLQENFLLTLLGSLLGLLISWLFVTLGAEWLPFIFSGERIEVFSMIEPVRIHADMLFSGWIMLAVLAATLLLNLISAFVPTLWALRRPVTEEINHER